MKKLMISAFVFLFIMILPICVYAAQPNANLEIKSGIDNFDKAESTFDESRTISGLADNGASVVIGVYTKNTKGELKANESYTISVGPSGLFSQSIDLCLGENVVQITASQEGVLDTAKTAVIKRKNRAIKDKLENEISIPGIQSFLYFP